GNLYVLNFWGDSEDETIGCIDGTYVSFEPLTIGINLYDGQTYTIYLYPTDYQGGNIYPNCEICENNDGDNDVIMCIDNYNYDYGQTITMQYKFPHPSMLNKHGHPTSGYILSLYDRDDYPRWKSIDNSLHVWYQSLDDFIMDGEFHLMQWIINESYGYTENWKRYSVTLWHEAWLDTMTCEGADHECTGAIFEPEGEILAISPDPCNMHQRVTISYTANTSGYITIQNSWTGEEFLLPPFVYVAGTHFSYFTPREEGRYYVFLYSNYDTSLLD
ncbi:unnamed protein product, partial [marine sediment metagenome]